MITQVFPDEFHLNTLDQLLPAIARLNPHVNIKAIVIGLMDRLSAYAEREAESESPKDRQKSEEEATAKLLEKLRLSKESKSSGPKGDKVEHEQTNSEQANGHKTIKASSLEDGHATEVNSLADDSSATEVDDKSTATNGDTEQPSSRGSKGIPEDVRLYEIFYNQVTHLVLAQRLSIQDTIALLVSLANLAL